LMGSEFQIVVRRYWNREISMTSYAVVLPAYENRMSTNTLQTDNTERGLWCVVDD